jgi:hypothetical protein
MARGVGGRGDLPPKLCCLLLFCGVVVVVAMRQFDY